MVDGVGIGGGIVSRWEGKWFVRISKGMLHSIRYKVKLDICMMLYRDSLASECPDAKCCSRRS